MKIRDGSTPWLAYNRVFMCSGIKRNVVICEKGKKKKKGKKNYKAPPRACLVIISFRWKTQTLPKRQRCAAGGPSLTFEGVAESWEKWRKRLKTAPWMSGDGESRLRRQFFSPTPPSYARCWPSGPSVCFTDHVELYLFIWVVRITRKQFHAFRFVHVIDYTLTRS